MEKNILTLGEKQICMQKMNITFFLKTMQAEPNFVKGADGKLEKAIVDDEGEHYELKKIK